MIDVYATWARGKLGDADASVPVMRGSGRANAVEVNKMTGAYVAPSLGG